MVGHFLSKMMKNWVWRKFVSKNCESSSKRESSESSISLINIDCIK